VGFRRPEILGWKEIEPQRRKGAKETGTRHCERSEAIQNPRLGYFWIAASLRSSQ